MCIVFVCKTVEWTDTYSKWNVFIQDFAQFRQHCSVMNGHEMKIQCTLFDIVEDFYFTLNAKVASNFSRTIPRFKFRNKTQKHLQVQNLSFENNSAPLIKKESKTKGLQAKYKTCLFIALRE